MQPGEGQFVLLPTDGEHYECKYCGAIFSDMTDFPMSAKLMIFETHIRECEGEIQ